MYLTYNRFEFMLACLHPFHVNLALPSELLRNWYGYSTQKWRYTLQPVTMLILKTSNAFNSGIWCAVQTEFRLNIVVGASKWYTWHLNLHSEFCSLHSAETWSQFRLDVLPSAISLMVIFYLKPMFSCSFLVLRSFSHLFLYSVKGENK